MTKVEPTEKDPAIEGMLESLSGRTTAIGEMRCVSPPEGCGRKIGEREFEVWDAQTKMEYRISGLCAECQEEVFGGVDG